MARRTVAGTAADPTIKFAKLELDGKTYSLCYDFNAIAIAESLCPGSNLLHGLLSLQQLNAVQLRGLLYAALLKAHPTITLYQAGEFVRLDRVEQICRAIAEAYGLSVEKPQNPMEPDALPAVKQDAA